MDMDNNIIRQIGRLLTEDPDVMAAPAPAPVAPPAKPRPRREPFKPFNPPKPKESPKPKAKAKKIEEDYDDEVDPSTRGFWSDIRKSKHTFGKHPLLAMYGEESARKAFENNIEKISRAFPEFANLPRQQRLNMIFGQAVNLFSRLERIESRYRDELEEIAIEIVSQVYKIPEDMLNAFLEKPSASDWDDDENGQEEEYDDYEDYEDSEEDLSSEVNKRITLNALSQGAAVHNMMTIHKLASAKIRQLDPKLENMYDQLSPGLLSPYWLMDFTRMAGMLKDNVVGKAQVKYSGDNPEVYASGMCFPVLVQELVKGVMELLSHHGLAGLDKRQTKKVLKQADVLEDEPWLIQIGPHLWRSFLKIVPKNSDLATVVARLAQQDPKWIHDLLSNTLENVHAGRDLTTQKEQLQEIIDEIEEYVDEEELDL